jgi:hypothetical protein
MAASRTMEATALALWTAACVHGRVVERAYDGDVVSGRFIEPDAYAAFLKGAVAEAHGDLQGALSWYGQASHLDASAADIWTRIGDVRCRADPHDAEADASFARALGLDGTYARAWAAKARCALARGDLPAVRRAAGRAAQLDPTADGSNVLLARTAGTTKDAATRASLLALTVTARDPVLAWDALATWAEAHGDVALWALALKELPRFSPTKRDQVARAAERLAGLGEIEQARAVAAAAADADARPMADGRALAARLALDEAIARVDEPSVRRRATRVRLPLDEAAGRALLAGHRSLARDLASSVARADPGAQGASLVLAASSGGDLIGVAHGAHGPRPGEQTPSAAAFVSFGVALARHVTTEQARAVLGALDHAPIMAGDDRVVRAAVELASRGVLSSDALPPDGLVELAALRAEAPPSLLLASSGALPIDARHEYLALALTHPETARARELAARLATDRTADPIVAAASALMQLATGEAIPGAAARDLLARDLADPLLAVTALRLAEKAGDHEIARRARAALTSLGNEPRPNVQ